MARDLLKIFFKDAIMSSLFYVKRKIEPISLSSGIPPDSRAKSRAVERVHQRPIDTFLALPNLIFLFLWRVSFRGKNGQKRRNLSQGMTLMPLWLIFSRRLERKTPHDAFKRNLLGLFRQRTAKSWPKALGSQPAEKEDEYGSIPPYKYGSLLSLIRRSLGIKWEISKLAPYSRAKKCQQCQWKLKAVNECH